MSCKKGWVFRSVSGLCAAALICGSFAGCAPSQTSSASLSQAGKTAASAGNEAVSFKIILPYTDEQAPKDNPVLKTLEEKTNSTIDIEWTPLISYGDKYSVMMNSGSYPDVLLIGDIKGATYLDAARNNQFWDLTPYLADGNYTGFKNLAKIAVENSKTDSKSYVIPRERTIKRKDVCYRVDWAKKAGLDAPDTVDKLYKMAKTFAEGDFDGNGKKDTVGLLLGTISDGGGQTIDCLNELVVANGGYNGWGLKDGKVVADKITPEYKNTIGLLRKMCQEGIVSKDFAITKTTSQMNEYIDKEKAGLWLSYGLPGLTDPLLKAKQKNNPNIKRSDIYGYTYLKDSGGSDRIPAETGYSNGFAFPKSTVKDEGKLKNLLRVFNYICTKDGQRLLNNGIEGRQYTLVNETTCKATSDKKLMQEFNCMNQMSCAGNYCLNMVSDEIGARLANERITYKDSELISDVSAPLNSDTTASKSMVLNKDFDTALFKYILGQTGDSDFTVAIQTWQKNGGDKIADEYTQSYQKSQGGK